MTFPYISQIEVNNCFTYKDFYVPSSPLIAFKHIILTGKNGAGKTTILNRIAFILSQYSVTSRTTVFNKHNLQGLIKANPNHANRRHWEQQLSYYDDLSLSLMSDENYLVEHANDYIFSHFKAQRRVELEMVTTVTREEEFVDKLDKKNDSGDFVKYFKQYIVNKKIYEAFDYMKSGEQVASKNRAFFNNFTDILRAVFEDDKLTLEFVHESFEFFLVFRDGRRVTFNQLSEGFSAFLSIIMDLLVRVDLLQKDRADFTYDPEGFVIIDEPETHFHLAMQYQILPLLSKLFPRIQLIVATHSPAVISSLENAMVFDLTSKREVSGWVIGSSFSELMVRHFGLDNEYSPKADNIIALIDHAVSREDISGLNEILSKNEEFLTPSLRLEIESQIIAIKNR
jgi:predicted ATP-binding protein involved in virulence